MDENTPRLCRRNLIFMSGLIMFYYYAGVNISGIKVLGTIVSFNNIDAIEHSLWVVFSYTYLRYLLIYIESPRESYHLAFMKKIRDAINTKLMQVEKDVYREIKGDDYILDSVIELRKGNYKGISFNVFRGLFSRSKNIKTIKNKSDVRINLIRGKNKISVQNKYSIPYVTYPIIYLVDNILGFRFWSYKWVASLYHMRKGAVSQDQCNGRFEMSGGTAFIIITKAHIKVIFSTPEFMEHQLPLIIGIFPIILFNAI